jgi:3-keto-5-aminohexanoate cleavage enzyme
MNAMIATGELNTPAYAAFLLSGESMLFGHPATSTGLRAYIDTLAGADVQWSVMINGTNFLTLLPEIIAAGGHVSIGLGDYPYPELGAPTNADLVRTVADYARSVGREIASPDEVRDMLAITGAKALA